MIDELELIRKLRLRYPHGLETGNSALGMTREFVDGVITMMAAEFRKAGHEILFALERDSTGTEVRGFIVYVFGVTERTDMVVSPGFVRMGHDQAYVAQPNGAPDLMFLLLEAVDRMIAVAKSKAA